MKTDFVGLMGKIRQILRIGLMESKDQNIQKTNARWLQLEKDGLTLRAQKEQTWVLVFFPYVKRPFKQVGTIRLLDR